MDRKKAEERARALVGQMTLDEKISQLIFESPAIERLGVPEYNWWNECLHGVAREGVATVYPQSIGMAASFDPGLMEEVARSIALEARAKYNQNRERGDRDIYKGLTFWSPNINIFRDPRWGRGQETYGEDPLLTSRMGVAFAKGLQGDGEYYMATACAKHFAAHSGPEELRHEFNAVVCQKDLHETYLPAFKALVEEGGVEAVMGAYNRLNGEFCCASPTLMKILRGDWGFQGHFVSDCGAIQDFWQFHRMTKDAVDSSAEALNAGLDLNCGCSYKSLKQACERGLVTEEQITQAAVRLFTTRFLLGMFEDVEPWSDIGPEVVECGEHRALNLKMATESVVMLRNENVLPFGKEVRTIAVVGPNANSRTALWGNYHGTASRWVTILEGIQDEAWARGMEVVYSEGSHLYLDSVEEGARDGDRISEAVSAALRGDVVVEVLGIDEKRAGETGDLKSYSLPECQLKLHEALAKTGRPLVTIIMAGGAMDLRFANDSGALLHAFYPGALGGWAVSDILFGKTSPSGKLPVTIYAEEDDIPPVADYSLRGRTYRYVEKKPLYPFGYGLTCAEMELGGFRADASGVSVKVVNKSGFAASEVVQLYAKPLESPLAAPNAALRAFRRIEVPAGGEAEVFFPYSGEWRKVCDEEGGEMTAPGPLQVSCGFGQACERSLELGVKSFTAVI